MNLGLVIPIPLFNDKSSLLHFSSSLFCSPYPFLPLYFEMRRRISLLLTWALSRQLARAQDMEFINPPRANVFASPSLNPVYVEGTTIEVIWTANSSFYPITIALRAKQDGILFPSSGIQGSILCTPRYLSQYSK